MTSRVDSLARLGTMCVSPAPDRLLETPLGRRTFLQYCALAVGQPLLSSHRHPEIPLIYHPRGSTSARTLGRWRAGDPPDAAMMHALAQRAIDAALAAGAAYADVRLTHTITEVLMGGWRSQSLDETYGVTILRDPVYRNGPTLGGVTLVMGIGVRAFLHGYWGFASSPVWTDAEAVRLGHEAAGQAKTYAAVGAPSAVELGTIPVVSHGRWIQPGIDPFTIPVDEKLDVLGALAEMVTQADRFTEANSRLESVKQLSLELWREERVFASSEGGAYTQVRYRTEPNFLVDAEYMGNPNGQPPTQAGSALWRLDAFAARGWECIRDQPLDTVVARLLADARHPNLEGLRGTGTNKPVEVGRYDVVMGAAATAALAYATLGVATELDRALGYEADAAGTSYLGPDPLRYLGQPVADERVTLRANRTRVGGLATVQWDDEGIEAQDFPLITDGVLVDYQTTRLQAPSLASWYAQHGLSPKSRGCATAETALDFPIQMSPNLELSPGHDTVDVADLIKDTIHGVYFPVGNVNIDVDYQVKSGVVSISPGPLEIRNGKLGATLANGALLFHSTDLWRNLIALGGPASRESIKTGEIKGQPAQAGRCNVTAVPIKIKNCAIIDSTRKA